ncbi:hypothetical protein B7486_44775 [cyanobacterium TDX16]|nr:hypothetical protein B7486_44775 [cyanobacterium TDX16]
MPKLPECDRCMFHSHDYHIVCVIHPTGVEGDSCLDFRPDPELRRLPFRDFLGVRSRQQSDEPYSNPHDYIDDNEELWQPESACYYNGELILQPQQLWTQEEQLELLDSHPMFTGKCPLCSTAIERDYTARVHWDCPNQECGWKDDTV